jgi:ribosomal protein L11 methyltransferase
MDYIELTITGYGDYDPEIIMAHLAELEFESFTEEAGTLKAYVAADRYDKDAAGDLVRELEKVAGIHHETRTIPAQNWNAAWESAYEPVVVAGRCRVRAPFHAPDPSMPYEIVIMPKMSFGTAHHETTALMLELMMEENLQGKRVLDMGCGTAVLAILAHLMQASDVVAVDTDEWAYENAIENTVANGAPGIRVIRGDASSIPVQSYDLVIANINRNVLLNDIPIYAGCLTPGGILFMSGFYEEDLAMIRSRAEQCGLHYSGHRTANNWTGVKFVK